MTDDLKALRAAADAATPGPWIKQATSWDFYVARECNPKFNSICSTAVSGERDVDFIAAFNPVVAKRLLDRLEAAERDAARKNSALSDAERVLSDFYANAKVRGCESAYKHFQDAALKCREAIDAARAAHQQEGV